MYRHQIRAHNIIWKRLDFGLTDWSKATELNLVDPGYDNVVSSTYYHLSRKVGSKYSLI